MKILCWNVNGLRAVHSKGLFLDWFLKEKADIVCVNETKSQIDQIPDELKNISGYYSYFSSAEKKGYSGTGLWTKINPIKTSFELGTKKFDNEGRLIRADFKDFILLNVYFPSGGMSEERLKFKLDYYDAFLEYLLQLKKKDKKIILTGDINTAHKEIDLAQPQQNENETGFLPVERAWIDKLVKNGFIDTFRMFEKEGGNYTYWDYRMLSRERNIGWRLDYFFVSENLKDKVKSSYIQKDVLGSDHCPICLEIQI
ncbi:MAG: exodeoxyribonuclease III [Elusimicrobia bacterium]|nr:exodeoxyribonuclease III [Elusimicrobiota bacterium]